MRVRGSSSGRAAVSQQQQRNGRRGCVNRAVLEAGSRFEQRHRYTSTRYKNLLSDDFHLFPGAADRTILWTSSPESWPGVCGPLFLTTAPHLVVAFSNESLTGGPVH
jgi:hypothetical protein